LAAAENAYHREAADHSRRLGSTVLDIDTTATPLNRVVAAIAGEIVSIWFGPSPLLERQPDDRRNPPRTRLRPYTPCDSADRQPGHRCGRRPCGATRRVR